MTEFITVVLSVSRCPRIRLAARQAYAPSTTLLVNACRFHARLLACVQSHVRACMSAKLYVPLSRSWTALRRSVFDLWRQPGQCV
eukprot:6198175-Pleurochrysis_carterae.AAC.1